MNILTLALILVWLQAAQPTIHDLHSGNFDGDALKPHGEPVHWPSFAWGAMSVVAFQGLVTAACFVWLWRQARTWPREEGER